MAVPSHTRIVECHYVTRLQLISQQSQASVNYNCAATGALDVNGMWLPNPNGHFDLQLQLETFEPGTRNTNTVFHLSAMLHKYTMLEWVEACSSNSKSIGTSPTW